MPEFKMSKFQFKIYFLLKRIHIKVLGIPMNVFINSIETVHIGKNVWLSPGVCIVSANHNVNDLSKLEETKDVFIGDNCWIGANSVILPGVILGQNTIVGANSVVNESFPEGYIIIGGSPAKQIRRLRQ